MPTRVTQQVFLKLWERRALLSNVEEPMAWLQTAARYQMMTLLKKQVATTEWDSVIEWADENQQWENPEQHFLLKEKQQTIEKAIRQLPPRQKEIFHYCREQGLTYAEIESTIRTYHGKPSRIIWVRH